MQRCCGGGAEAQSCTAAQLLRCRGGAEVQRWRGAEVFAEVQRCRGAEVHQRCRDSAEALQRWCRVGAGADVVHVRCRADAMVVHTMCRVVVAEAEQVLNRRRGRC